MINYLADNIYVNICYLVYVSTAVINATFFALYLYYYIYIFLFTVLLSFFYYLCVLLPVHQLTHVKLVPSCCVKPCIVLLFYLCRL